MQLIAKLSPYRTSPPRCGGAVGVITGIEDPVVIDKILTHLEKKAVWAEPVVLSQNRALPQRKLFD